mgnify:CR=1 FL=1
MGCAVVHSTSYLRLSPKCSKVTNSPTTWWHNTQCITKYMADSKIMRWCDAGGSRLARLTSCTTVRTRVQSLTDSMHADIDAAVNFCIFWG